MLARRLLAAVPPSVIGRVSAHDVFLSHLRAFLVAPEKNFPSHAFGRTQILRDSSIRRLDVAGGRLHLPLGGL
ncbi:hypothetical protein OIDMADRAFT_16047, partial [Oidiodendron maius Zn]